ncbi:MAG TPA: M23 family metallopeptidase [Conexibacter sp.]|nr:M23 family metallopeptidase [Conexibacter sp.]
MAAGTTGGATVGGASPGSAPTQTATSARTGGALVGQKPRARRKPKPKAVHRRTAKPRARTPAARPPAAPVVPTVAGVFPVLGPWTFGGAGARFGAGRTGHIHQGQDVVAASGQTIVAPVAGSVMWEANQPGGAGIYLVEHGADGRDYVFMHIKDRTLLVRVGETLTPGEPIAQVGATGDASGPHLHFEIWVGGWQARGGAPTDPLPQLQRWAGLS